MRALKKVLSDNPNTITKTDLDKVERLRLVGELDAMRERKKAVALLRGGR